MSGLCVHGGELLYGYHGHRTQKETTMLRLAILLVAILGLSACEATKGLGRDLQNAGQALDDAI